MYQVADTPASAAAVRRSVAGTYPVAARVVFKWVGGRDVPLAEDLFPTMCVGHECVCVCACACVSSDRRTGRKEGRK